MKLKNIFDRKSTAGFGEYSKTRPTATFNEYIRCATMPNDDGTATVRVTPMEGYELAFADGDGNLVREVKLLAVPLINPVVGRSYMLDSKEVTVGRIDRDEGGKAVAVYDEHTGEKHLWRAQRASRI